MSIETHIGVNRYMKQTVVGDTSTPVVEYSRGEEGYRHFTDGSGDYQCNRAWHGFITIPGSNNVKIDLYPIDGSNFPLYDRFNNLIQLGSVKWFYFRNTDAANALSLFWACTNVWTGPFGTGFSSPGWPLPPGGEFEKMEPKSGWAVSAGSSLIQINAETSNSTILEFACAGVSRT